MLTAPIGDGGNYVRSLPVPVTRQVPVPFFFVCKIILVSYENITSAIATTRAKQQNEYIANNEVVIQGFCLPDSIMWPQ